MGPENYWWSRVLLIDDEEVCRRPRIAAKTPASSEELQRDLDLQDVIALNLQRAVQLSVDLAAHVIADTDVRPPSTMAENFSLLKDLAIITPALAERINKAVGFRNIAVHTYQHIDWNIVYQICRHHLDDFRQFAQAVNNRLPPQQNSTT